jgi:hypothetical protein
MWCSVTTSTDRGPAARTIARELAIPQVEGSIRFRCYVAAELITDQSAA